MNISKYIFKMKKPSPVGYISAIILLIFTVGVYKQLTQKTANNCEMTFMFEYPHFVEISVPKNRGKYNLYAYTEGQTMEKIKSMKFYGTPVIFIPGHSGSYRQVRSIASVNIRKMYHIQSNIKFDFFTVDLNEEYSAVFGGVLLQQTEFVSQCIDTIIKTYEFDYKPTSIILIGHSMGGIIAKGLFINATFDTNLVELIITLATPHRPLFLADHYMDSYYDKVENIWGNGLDKPRSSFLSNISLLSIGGGHRDLMVWPCLTYTPHADINVLSLAIPGVWTSTDHQCILWCKSLVKAIVRVLFDSAEFNSDESIFEWRKKVSTYHFDKRSDGKWFHSNLHPRTVKLKESNVIEWNETYKVQRSIFLESGTSMPIVINVPLVNKSLSYELTAEAINIDYHDWVFSCKPEYSKKYCLFGVNWSSNSTISVSKYLKRRHITLIISDVYKLGHSNLVFKMKNTKKPTGLNIDLYETNDRTNQLPWKFWYGVFEKKLLWEVNVFDTIQYKTILQGWSDSICMNCVYNVFMTPTKCLKKKHHAVSKFIVPWIQGSLHSFTSNNLVEPLRISLENIISSNKTVDPYLQFILDPSCNYRIELELSIMDTIGTMGLKYGLTFPSYIGIIILLVLSHQFSQLANSTENACSIYHNSLPSLYKTTKILIISICLMIIIQYQWPHLNKPIGGVDWLGYPLKIIIFSSILYCITNSFMYFATLALWLMMLFWGKAINELLVRFIMKALQKNATISDWVLYGFGKLPIVVSMISILMSYNTCGTVGLFISSFFYYFMICTMVQDCIDQLIYYPVLFIKEYFIKGGDKPVLNLSLTSIHLHFSLFLLWLLICGCHLPCSIEWARNYHHSKYLDPDPSWISSLILNMCVGIIWQIDIPKHKLKFYAELSDLCIATSIILFVFCQTALYRIAPILTLIFLIITLHQCVSSWIGVRDLNDIKVNKSKDNKQKNN